MKHTAMVKKEGEVDLESLWMDISCSFCTRSDPHLSAVSSQTLLVTTWFETRGTLEDSLIASNAKGKVEPQRKNWKINVIHWTPVENTRIRFVLNAGFPTGIFHFVLLSNMAMLVHQHQTHTNQHRPAWTFIQQGRIHFIFCHDVSHKVHGTT